MNAGYVLLAAAGLLLLWKLGSSRSAASGGRTEVPPPGGGVQPQGAAGNSALQQATGVMPESVGVAPPDDVLEQAALDPSKAHLAGEWRQSWHKWNYYRALAAVKAGLCSPPCSEYAPDLGSKFSLPHNQGLTASEYHGYLSQAGMSGMAWTYRKSYRRPWL